VLRIFQSGNQHSRKEGIQSRLILLAALLVVIYALILTIAPAIRLHKGIEAFQFRHWLGVIAWVAAFAFLHNQIEKHLPSTDPYLLPIIGALTGVGLMTIWRLYPNLGLRQTAWVAIGSLILFLGVRFSTFLDYLHRYKYIWLVLGLILTALTIIVGENPGGDGPRLWLQFIGIYFQPSEPLKLLLIVYLAGFFSDRVLIKRQSKEYFLPIIFVTGIAVLLLVFQRDLGTASIFLLIFLGMLYSGSNHKWFTWLSLVVILIAAVLGYLFVDIVKARIDSWLNPFLDPTNASYQVIQSMIAIAEGGLIGSGPGLGSPGLVPVSVSDFIFSAIAEELGYLGSSFIILLIVLLIYRSVIIASSSQKLFHRYLALGVAFYFGFQSILIIGGNIGFLPLTGVTLPFVSYGGSSLTVSFSAVLLLLVISQKSSAAEQTPNEKTPRYILVSSLLIIILMVEILASSLLAFWFSPDLIARPENPRWVIEDRYVPRGDILDRENRIIVQTIGDIGSYNRDSNYIPLYPIIGYTNGTYGQTGIESSMFNYLRGYLGYPYSDQFWKYLLKNQPPEGLDVRLTIDLDLQETADELLGDHVGSAILMNAKTGEILAMASHPYFDGAKLNEKWEELILDETAPLINRVTQGVYPPGSSLLPFILTTQLELTQNCTNPEDRFPSLQGDMMCAQAINEDEITWKSLTANGCLTAQVELGTLTGLTSLLNLYEDLGFYSSPELRLEVAEINKTDITNESAFLKGEQAVNINPLQMALAASALTNDGILPSARIVNGYQGPEGNWITLPKLGEGYQALHSASASDVISLLQVTGTSYWGATAWAQTEDGDKITWFIGGTSPDWQGQPIVAVVVLESDNPKSAENIGNTLMRGATH
jgi:cell division protein FtsW (lipid II flippase)